MQDRISLSLTSTRSLPQKNVSHDMNSPTFTLCTQP